MVSPFALAVVVLFLSGAASEAVLNSSTTSLAIPTLANHLVVVVMENKSLNSTYNCGGNCSYITQLANNYGLAVNYSGVAHKSLPNYLTLTSGGNYSGPMTGNNFSADCSPFNCEVNGTNNNLIDLIERSGRTWKAYMEDYTGGCKLIDTSGGIRNSTATSGTYYDSNHNPFVYYSDIRANSTRCANVVDANPSHTGYLALPQQLILDLNSTNPPDFMWLTPNLCDDGHDRCLPLNNTVSQSNKYLASLVPLILGSKTFLLPNSVLFITWDEGSVCSSLSQTYPTCRDRVTTIWAGPGARRGYGSSKAYSHYSFVTTLEALWSLSPQLQIPAGITAPTMLEFMAITVIQPQLGGGRHAYPM